VDLGIDVYLVDEIGKMECLSPGFVAAMRALLDSGRPVVATIGERGGGFIAEAKQRPDVTLWRLTRDNRDAVPARILTWLRDHAEGRGAVADDPGRITGGVGGRAEVEQADGKINAARPLERHAPALEPAGRLGDGRGRGGIGQRVHLAGLRNIPVLSEAAGVGNVREDLEELAERLLGS
jgi:hypothetical protein